MANVFDQFDASPAAAPAGNVFDQFDAPKKSDNGWLSPITGVPHEIYQAGADAIQGIKENLNPFSEQRRAATLSGDVLGPLASTGKGLLSAASLPMAPITGAARSLIGRPYSWMMPTLTPAEQQRLRGAGISENLIPGATQDENYEKAKGDVDTALMAMRPAGSPVHAVLPSRNLGPTGRPWDNSPAPGKFEIDPSRAAYEWSTNVPQTPPPAPTPNGPLGVTLSEGQATGELPLIQREQAAFRGQSGEGVQARAQEFSDQQRGQVESAADTVARRMDPLGQTFAASPQEAGEAVSNALVRHGELRRQQLDAEASTLQPPNLPHPFESAETVANALRNSTDARAVARANNEAALASEHGAIRSGLSRDGNVIASNPQEAAEVVSGAVTRAEEQATAARDAAYDRFREQQGEFSPTAFRGVGNAVRRSLNAGDDPVILNSKVTPMATGALQDMERNLGASARNALSPDTASYRPFTPSLIDDARKRLLSFQRQANNTARSTGDFSDVRAMGRITDAFDDIVQRSLRNPEQFTGDGAAVADALAEARGLHSELRRTFSRQGSGDKVGPIMQQIIGQREGQAAPANQIAQWLYGTGQTPVLMARRMNQLFGPTSPEVGALKQGLFSYITERPEGVTAWGPEQVASRIYDFVNGRGRALTQEYFSPQEMRSLTGYADRLRASVEPPRPATDVVGKSLERIVGEGGQGATAPELADTLFGRSGIGENPLGTKIAQHVRDTYGQNSEPFNALRQGMFSRLTGAEHGRIGFDPEAIATRIDGFLSGRGRALAETLFSEPERANLRQYGDALRSHAERTAAPTDPVERVISKISGRDGGTPATAREVADLMYSRSIARDSSLSVDLAKRLRDDLGPSSPQWSAVKQGMFRHLIEPGEGMKDWGPGKIAQRLTKFLNVDGVELANEMYSPAERALIREYANLQRKLEVPQAGANWSGSGTAMAPLLKKISGGISGLIGAAIGHVVAPGAFGVGEFVGSQATSKIGAAVSNAREMRRVQQQMPLVADQMKAWQRATNAAMRANTPASQAALNAASANLASSLQRLGIDPRTLIQGPQGTVPARADQQQQQ